MESLRRPLLLPIVGKEAEPLQFSAVMDAANVARGNLI